jgi:hypothetical protein
VRKREQVREPGSEAGENRHGCLVAVGNTSEHEVNATRSSTRLSSPLSSSSVLLLLLRGRSRKRVYEKGMQTDGRTRVHDPKNMSMMMLPRSSGGPPTTKTRYSISGIVHSRPNTVISARPDGSVVECVHVPGGSRGEGNGSSSSRSQVARQPLAFRKNCDARPKSEANTQTVLRGPIAEDG